MFNLMDLAFPYQVCMDITMICDDRGYLYLTEYDDTLYTSNFLSAVYVNDNLEVSLVPMIVYRS